MKEISARRVEEMSHMVDRVTSLSKAINCVTPDEKELQENGQ